MKMATATATREITPADFMMEPDPLALCGKATRIGYNGTQALVKRLYCDRWDCPRCARRKREEYKRRMRAGSPEWYVSDIPSEDYARITKQLRRADTEYWAVASGGEFRILAKNEIIPDARRVTSDAELDGTRDEVLTKEQNPLNGARKVRHGGSGSAQAGSSAPTTAAKAEGDVTMSESDRPTPRDGGEQWQWASVEESPEEVCAKLREAGCRIVWRDGNDVARVVDITPEGHRMLKSLFEKDQGPPAFSKLQW